MTTSLNEIKTVEDFLNGKLIPEESLLFRAGLLIDPLLRMNVSMQKKTYSLIRLYGRRKLRSEITTIQEKIFNDPANALFKQRIEQLFSKYQ